MNKFIIIGNLLFFKPGQISPSPIGFVWIFDKAKIYNLQLLGLKEKQKRPTNMTLRCSCAAVQFLVIAFFSYWTPPPPVGLR